MAGRCALLVQVQIDRGVAFYVVDCAFEFVFDIACRFAEFAHRFAEAACKLGQFFPAKEEQHHKQDHHEFGAADSFDERGVRGEQKGVHGWASTLSGLGGACKFKVRVLRSLRLRGGGRRLVCRRMLPKALTFIGFFALLVFGAVSLHAEENESAPVTTQAVPDEAVATESAQASTAPQQLKVAVIPIREAIGKPVLYVVRRGLKDAIELGADIVLIDMDTPGGEAGAMLQIMEALDKFPGQKLTYVNSEAISAGAIIASVSDEIYFAPRGVMGAADVVTGSGGDLPAGMKRKIDSYLSAKIESYTMHAPRRADVIKAMRIPEFEFKLDGQIIKEKGELLTLTAEKAIALYGDPPTPLLAAGVADDIGSLLDSRFGADGYALTRLDATWSEQLAVWLSGLVPLMLGLGLLALFIEFKTPGFGIFGVAGITLLGLVFLSNFVAGLSGHEPVLIFALGLVLVGVELFFLPGTVVFALSGILLMLGSLLWSMADIWPNEPLTISGDVFLSPLMNLGTGLALAIVGGLALLRFLPKGMFWDRVVLAAAATGTSAPEIEEESLIGREGVAATALFPSGQIELDGRRYEARVAVGTVDLGQRVVVRARREFELLVERVDSPPPFRVSAAAEQNSTATSSTEPLAQTESPQPPAVAGAEAAPTATNDEGSPRA